MNNQYHVIRVPGSWIEREQIKQRLKMFLGLDILDEKDVVTYRARQCFTKEQADISGVDMRERTKRKIARCLAEHLLESGALRFTESQNLHHILLDGEITFIGERREEGESNDRN